MNDGNAEPSASTKLEWNTAQSSILAPILPVTSWAAPVKGIVQSVRESDQSNGPLQSLAVVNIAIQRNESFFEPNR